MTNRQNVRTRPSNDFANLLSLMLVCLVFLSLGNLVFHVRVLPITESGLQFLLAHFSVPMEVYSDVPQFFWTVIVAAQEDILFVLLIAFSCLLRVRRIFIFSVFAYKSFVFGFCGACIIGSIPLFNSFFQGCLSWLFFFIYHILLFSILLCFGDKTATLYAWESRKTRLNYMISLCGEIALVILLKAVYFFLISIT